MFYKNLQLKIIYNFKNLYYIMYAIVYIIVLSLLDKNITYLCLNIFYKMIIIIN